jgi:hypothetical protein
MRSQIFGALALFVTGNGGTGNKDKEAFGRSTYAMFIVSPRVRDGRRCCALFGCRRSWSGLQLDKRLPSKRWRIGLQPPRLQPSHDRRSRPRRGWKRGREWLSKRVGKRSFGCQYERLDHRIGKRSFDWQCERLDHRIGKRSFDWQCERLDHRISKRSFDWQCKRLDHRIGKRSHDWCCKWLDDDVKRSLDWQR